MTNKGILIALTIGALALTATALTNDPLKDARHITACLLKYAHDLAPVMMLAFIIVGGLTYLTAGESRKQAMFGKKFGTFGIVGAVCIYALCLIAAQPPFSVNYEECTSSGGGTPPETTKEPAILAPGDPSCGPVGSICT